MESYGKIRVITKSNGTSIRYTYDASGNRISKSITKNSHSTTTWYLRDVSGNTLSVYNAGIDLVNNGDLSQTEIQLFGGGRLGILQSPTNVQHLAPANDTILPLLGKGFGITFTRGNKLFELTNHLGNVLTTVSDKKFGFSMNDSTVDHYISANVSAQDYYPFGMQVPGENDKQRK